MYGCTHLINIHEIISYKLHLACSKVVNIQFTFIFVYVGRVSSPSSHNMKIVGIQTSHGDMS